MLRSQPLPRDRESLIAEMHDRLMRTSMPRVVMLLIVSMAGLGAFLTAFVSLRLGLTSMGVRYFIASVAGYLVFVALVRFWIALRRSRTEAIADALDVLNVPGDLAYEVGSGIGDGGRQAIDFVGEIGRRGGRVAAGSWSDSPAPVEGTRTAARAGVDAGWFSWDEGAWLLITGVVLAGGAIAVGFVVWSAPMLLAEVALDAALVSTIYRKLRKQDAGHWLGALWRRTWLPALMLVGFMTILGIALQQMAPEAVSIGGVFRAR